MLLRAIKNIFHLELDAQYSSEEVDSFFYLLVEHYLNLERFVLAVQPDLNISKEQEQPFFEALSALKLNQPIQYIIGKTSFAGMEFFVDENVLIPRPETAELVQWIIEEVQSTKYEVRGTTASSAIQILDIGTGSGCIAVSLAKNLPNADLVAFDVSEKALEVAKKNAEHNGAKIIFLQADILNLKSVDALFEKRKFDIIVSNPPYVREIEKKEMSKNVLDHEPSSSLFVPDENPLVFYQSICEFAQNNLKPEGLLYLEINQYLAEETEQLLEANNFQDIELRKDIFGNDRMLKGRLN